MFKHDYKLPELVDFDPELLREVYIAYIQLKDMISASYLSSINKTCGICGNSYWIAATRHLSKIDTESIEDTKAWYRACYASYIGWEYPRYNISINTFEKAVFPIRCIDDCIITGVTKWENESLAARLDLLDYAIKHIREHLKSIFFVTDDKYK